jgi:MFS family permease
MSEVVQNVVSSRALKEKQTQRSGLFVFLTVWLGETISVIGSGLTGFGLGVWVYQRTGSATRFSLILLCSVVPGIFLSPFLGVIVDRYNRRAMMIVSNMTAAISTLLMAILYLNNHLQLWHICVLLVIISLSSSLLTPAYSATIPSLVSKEFLGRASGMVQFGLAASDMLAPLLAGFLIVAIHLHGILIIDFATYLFSILTLAVVSFPAVSPPSSPAISNPSMMSELMTGWRYLLVRPGLLALMGFFTITNFILAMDNVLLPPMVISLGGATMFGIVAAVGGIGMLLGSIVMSLWGGPKRRIRGVYLYGLVFGSALVLEGSRPDFWLIAIAAFFAAFVAPIANGCCIPILQTKTEPALQGRVYTTMRFLVGWSLPISYLLAGRLADNIFEPLMLRNGSLSNTVGRIIGIGPGRGAALLLVILGILTLVITLRALSYRPLLRVESEVPDAIGPMLQAISK